MWNLAEGGSVSPAPSVERLHVLLSPRIPGAIERDGNDDQNTGLCVCPLISCRVALIKPLALPYLYLSDKGMLIHGVSENERILQVPGTVSIGFCSVRDVQTSASASPNHRAPAGRKGKRSEEGGRGEGNRATSPTGRWQEQDK